MRNCVLLLVVVLAGCGEQPAPVVKSPIRKVEVLQEEVVQPKKKTLTLESATAATPEEITDEEIALIVKEHVKGALKSPSTAVFPEIKVSRAPKKSELFVLESYVDSQNSFGGMMRTRYSLMGTFKDSGWKCVIMSTKQDK